MTHLNTMHKPECVCELDVMETLEPTNSVRFPEIKFMPQERGLN